MIPKGSLEKPAHGSPCNRCGQCCQATICPLGQNIFGRKLGPCPALSFDAERKSCCGLVANPMAYAIAITLEHGVAAASEAAISLIGSGTGCDARFNGETPNEEFYSKLREWDRANASKTRRARKIWRV